MLTFAGIVAGLVLLIAGGSALVRGASEIAVVLGVSPMIVGLTIVGFGTSSPELVVNVIGAYSFEVIRQFEALLDAVFLWVLCRDVEFVGSWV